jgi:hypothetical protein
MTSKKEMEKNGRRPKKIMENNLKKNFKKTFKKIVFLIPPRFRANLSWGWLSSLRFFTIVSYLNSPRKGYPRGMNICV